MSPDVETRYIAFLQQVIDIQITYSKSAIPKPKILYFRTDKADREHLYDSAVLGLYCKQFA